MRILLSWENQIGCVVKTTDKCTVMFLPSFSLSQIETTFYCELLEYEVVMQN